ncbi:MAG: DUF3616 domain-containing protein [Pseudomonadota bacterium]
MDGLTRLILLFSFLLISVAASLAGPADKPWEKDKTVRYFGICDGSAAILIDDTTLLVANDETNVFHSFDVLGGPPLASFDIGKLLMLDPDNPEVDFEAVARDGDRLWWIGSHGLNGKAEKQPNRRILVATNVPRRDLSDLALQSAQYDLVPALKAHSGLSEILTRKVLKTAPKKGGLNIEGLAIAPDGSLVLGLRAPLTEKDGTKGDALIVSLSLENNAWSVSSFERLPLKDRGIRDMVWTGDGLVLIAGEVDDGRPSVLRIWSKTEKVEPIEAPSFKGFNAEALVKIGLKWLVMSDDGSKQRSAANGKKQDCKDLQEDGGTKGVFFRGRILSQR